MFVIVAVVNLMVLFHLKHVYIIVHSYFDLNETEKGSRGRIQEIGASS